MSTPLPLLETLSYPISLLIAAILSTVISDEYLICHERHIDTKL